MRATGFLFAAALAMAQNTPPRALPHDQPSYTDEAREAQVNATALVKLIVGSDGVPKNIAIMRGAGFGLDENAIAAVSAWRFKPGMKAGAPVDQAATVEVFFRLLNARHDGQLARLNFKLAAGASRPELTRGRIPDNPSGSDPYRLLVALTVGPDGKPKDVRVIESTIEKWGDAAARQIANWRFRPGDGEVTGELEVTRGMPAPRVAAPAPAGAVDSSLTAPKLISPPEVAIFDTYPRTTTLTWEASPGAASYIVETGYSESAGWHTGVGGPVSGTTFTFDFVGAQPGRWRVWPVNGAGARGTPSEWRTFRYTR